MRAQRFQQRLAGGLPLSSTVLCDLTVEHAAALEGFIASSGGRCAGIVGVEGEDLSNKVKVTCIEQAGAPGTVSYTVDLESGQAHKDR